MEIVCGMIDDTTELLVLRAFINAITELPRQMLEEPLVRRKIQSCQIEEGCCESDISYSGVLSEGRFSTAEVVSWQGLYWVVCRCLPSSS